MINRKEAVKMVRREKKFWIEGYPKQEVIIENFANKIICELELMKEEKP